MTENTQTPEQRDGKWYVGDVAFETNAAAWRYIDRRDGQVISKAEDTAAWIWSKMANGEA